MIHGDQEQLVSVWIKIMGMVADSRPIASEVHKHWTCWKRCTYIFSNMFENKIVHASC